MKGAILVGHGSRLNYNKELLIKLSETFKEYFDGKIIEIGFMEMNTPKIMDAIRSAVKKGADELYIVPVFLAKGIHTTEDIPNEVGGFQSGKSFMDLDGKKVKLIYCEPIGPDRRIAEILWDRVKEKY
ncbi:MAG: Sirohydrochlorin cobaltochelatase [Candidatus Methanofastidiosum methylothiophilum]|uniref:Sirohydrochlorin cobaltochelatase n=1 Tax=Candidatus Methanofastidiosum methylothiophilum TaxID=1705564 RepID=A0A150IKT0_9EURY|nr:MAG: Sirohydrochlorin cobaltochelatase [Candidatus Methanofastidiosum methylthiophilus]KYC47733.1 MAG: Sirohydrochlorin cobaltochelatase [Candidatus Methanofastidiosum methylthiophilus]KYC50504.1 MAG: Sirohydrochlorin cobaltochelatase [Candidatus Methanofastidiosum methylthiophilus]